MWTTTRHEHLAGRAPTHPRERARRWVSDHPFAGFVLLAYAISWTCWGLSALVGGAPAVVLLVLGALGPLLSAWWCLRLRGEDVGDWARRLLRWRVHPTAWAYALLAPIGVYLAVDAVLVLLGEPVAWGDLPAQLPAYLATFAVVATVFGGLEEPGWRGYALPLLQRSRSPVRATLLLGLVWGVWHVPLYGVAGFVVPLVLAFFYTWLWNRTGSVLLCLVLHASFTAAQDHLVLATDSMTVDLAILGVYVVGATGLVLLTRGRLGVRDGAGA